MNDCTTSSLRVHEFGGGGVTYLSCVQEVPRTFVGVKKELRKSLSQLIYKLKLAEFMGSDFRATQSILGVIHKYLHS